MLGIGSGSFDPETLVILETALVNVNCVLGTRRDVQQQTIARNGWKRRICAYGPRTTRRCPGPPPIQLPTAPTCSEPPLIDSVRKRAAAAA